MAVVIKPITVEVSKPNIFQAIAAKQNDCNSRFLKVTFVNEGEKIFITPAAKVTINAIRNDGKSESFFGTVNADGTATVPIHSWILELVGDVTCDVSIIEADSKLTCTSFSLLIEKATRNSDDVSQDPQYDVLTDLIQKVNLLDDEMIAYTESTFTKIPRTVALESKTNELTKRITNLEQGIIPSPFVTDDGVAYQKDVPSNALPYAEVEKIGGMTRKSTNLAPPMDATFPFTFYGVTFTDNGDGSYTANGTATSSGTIRLPLDMSTLKIGTTYYLNMFASEDVYNKLSLLGVDTSSQYRTDVFIHSEEMSYFVLRVQSGSVFNSVRFWYSLTDISAQHYEPYFEGLRSAPVSEVESVGANLLDPKSVTNRINTTINNGIITQIQADTNEYSVFKCQTFNEETLIESRSSSEYVTSAGVYGAVMRKTDEVNRIVFGLNGSVVDTTVSASVDHLPNGTYFVSVNFTNITQGSVTWQDMMINKGETALPYSPYVRNTLPISAEVQALDGYGWGVNESVYNYIDWERKQFVKRVGKVDLGTIEWVKSTFADGRWCFVSGGISDLKHANGSYVVINALCNLYNATSLQDTWVDKDIAYYYTSGNTVAVMDFDYTDATTFKSAMDGVMLYYELATPIITDISDILNEDNYIGVEAGGTITLVNEHQYAVPSSITYQVKGDA